MKDAGVCNHPKGQPEQQAAEVPATRESPALAWPREAWDDEEIIYDGEWDDLLRSGK